jgi:hypothetical protein
MKNNLSLSNINMSEVMVNHWSSTCGKYWLSLFRGHGNHYYFRESSGFKSLEKQMSENQALKQCESLINLYYLVDGIKLNKVI